MVLLFSLPLVPELTIMEGNTGKQLLAIPAQPNSQFQIVYIHSIHRTPVTEYYHIDSQLNIVVDKMVFDTFGVGMPSDVENGEKFTIENGKFVLNHLNRVLPSFDLRIGQVIANHKFIANGKSIKMSTLTKPGNWVRFQVKKKVYCK